MNAQKNCWKHFDFLHVSVADNSLVVIAIVTGGVVLETSMAKSDNYWDLIVSYQDEGVGVVTNVIVNGAVSSGLRLRA